MANQKPVVELQRLRLDKWLWAARFYKTRAVAKQAIEGGKVHCDGSRSKPSKEIIIGKVPFSNRASANDVRIQEFGTVVASSP